MYLIYLLLYHIKHDFKGLRKKEKNCVSSVSGVSGR